MVKIRLTRIGKKKTPYYKIVVSDSRNPVDGRFIEQVGTYDPNTDPGTVKVDAEAVRRWLANGAQPTDTVAKLLRQAGIGKGGAEVTVKAPKQKNASKTAAPAPAEQEAPAEEAAPAEAPAEEAAPAEENTEA